MKNSQLSDFESFSWPVEQFFLSVTQNNFGSKIPLLQQKNKFLFLFLFFQLKLIMESNCEDVYLHNGVVVLTKEPTDRANLGNFLKGSIQNGNFLEKTVFHLCVVFTQMRMESH